MINFVQFENHRIEKSYFLSPAQECQHCFQTIPITCLCLGIVMRLPSYLVSISYVKGNVGVFVLYRNSYLVKLNTIYPDPVVQGAQKGDPVGFWSLSCAFWWILYKTIVAGHPQLSGGRSPVQTPNPDLEGPGPGVLMEPLSFTFKGSL